MPHNMDIPEGAKRMDKYQIFKEAVSSRDSEVSKEALFEYAENNNIQIKNKRISRVNLVNEIYSSCKENFYDNFKFQVYVQHWLIAKFFDITSAQLETLRNAGFLDERKIDYSEKTFSGKCEKYQTFAYQSSILELNKADFNEVFQETYERYPVRLETKTREEAEKIIEKLAAVAEITQTATSYEHRDKKGYYTYFSIRPFANTTYEQNKYLADIEKLKKQLKASEEKLKQEHHDHQQEIDKALEKYRKNIADWLGISENFRGIDLIELRNKLNQLEKRNTENK